MREIKYRAWFAKQKIMLSVNHIHFDRKNDRQDILVNCVYVESSKCILMQYIGLKDKNKQEIYEGDIIKCSHGFIMKVVWEPYRLGWGLQDKKNTTWNHPTQHLFACEVIGNIYENKEVLK